MESYIIKPSVAEVDTRLQNSLYKIQKHAPKPSFFSVTEQRQIASAILEQLKLGAVIKVKPCKAQFLSPYFLVKKPDGSYRFILNLKQLNKFLSPPHFKMEDVRSATKLMSKGCFMTTVDLKSAYFLVPVHKTSRKYLRFMFKKQIYEFTCLPFGLSWAAFIFTKLLKPVAGLLRKNGISCVFYLDDILIFGDSSEECNNNTRLVIATLENLGFVINFQKSCTSPTQRCKFLGFFLNSTTMSLELTEEKRKNILQKTNKFLLLKQCKIREFAHYIGLLTAACPAVRYGWVYMKMFERQKCIALQKCDYNYNTVMSLPNVLQSDLLLWKKNILTASNSIRKDSFQLEIFTDASPIRWGAFCHGDRTHAWWTVPQQEYHINYLELLAIFYGLKCFAKSVTNANVLVRVDNTTAMSYINRMEGVKFPQLAYLAKIIWQWCEERGLWIHASYVSSADNFHADKESRILPSDTEWELTSNAFRKLVEKFG